ncbi:TetR/AcrR family transcriptional regulator [Acrocarpospora macrocephala]|uniref:TetR/AcrR family transcriptional regulator n=1 Tax=Acrocarpospora macrocephala TaxID=150177 RepID=UPI00147821D4|nr:TetR/AcrR family transcriptional regulator [Acrocarpospora macrocephala]
MTGSRRAAGDAVETPEPPNPRISRRQASAEESRRKLLEAALSHFSRRSYDEVTAAEITDTAGVAAGLLFHHFQNKRGIYLEALAEATRRLEAAHDTDHEAEPGVQVRQMLHHHFTYLIENRELALNVILARNAVGHEASDAFELTRWDTITWACRLLDLDPDHPALRLMWRTFGGASDQLTVTLLQTGRPYAIDSLVEALVEILAGALRGAAVLDPELEVGKAVDELRRHKPSAR